MAAPYEASRNDVHSAGTAPPALWRAPLLILGFAALITGVAAGLARLGWSVPVALASSASQHGVLMICGFFGVVISLERAVAIGRGWAYIGPALAGAAAIATISGEIGIAQWLFLVASLALLAASLDILRRQPALFTFMIMLGALCWAVGNALWAIGSTVHHAVAWWLAFPILTIAGERLELSRFLPPSPVAKRVFVGIVVAILAGMMVDQLMGHASVFALGLLALAAWLLKQDIARRTVRKQELTRFIAVCLLSGYAWLAIGGGILLTAGSLSPGSAAYDAALHALALGFVFSMVFGHAPIIFPSVLRVELPYHAYFYAPLALLHLSLLIRLAGDATGQWSWTQAGGMLNALALAAFVAGMLSAAVQAKLAHRRTS